MKKKLILLAIMFFLIVITIFMTNCTEKKKTKAIHFGLVIHGGAGTITPENTSSEAAQQYNDVLTKALKIGYQLLEAGNSSVDAVEQVIMVLEDSPIFNAGRGAVFNDLGRFELDASIMEGKNLNAGAVAGVTIVKNPIQAARKVMEISPHVLLSGEGANIFAEKQDLTLVKNDYFMTNKRKTQWLKIKSVRDKQKIEAQELEKEGKFGTVGVAALDKQGNLAAGTSTGGMKLKKYGRIGDSPIIGAGTYADNNSCAISCTGHGEYFIRYAVAHDISALISYKKMPLRQAVEWVIHNKLEKTGGVGGVVAIDTCGNVAMDFNTPGMFRGFYLEGGDPIVKMFAEKDTLDVKEDSVSMDSK